MAARDESIMSQTMASSGPSTLQQVTGPGAFWALLPLALNAMGQQSSTATAFFSSSGLTDGMLVPHLSSPVFAAMDCILDLVLVVRTLVHPAADTLPDAASPVYTKGDIQIEKMTVRLVLFLFGVLPQAIRIFGMKGISLTQALAAVFVSTSIARMLSIMAVRWTGRKNDDLIVWLRATDRRKMTTKRFVLLLHIGLCSAIWFQIAQVPHLNRTPGHDTVGKVCETVYYTGFTIAFAATCYWILGMFFSPPKQRKFVILPMSPFTVLVLLWPWLEYPDYLLRAGDARLRCEQDQSRPIEKCIADRTRMWDAYPMNTFPSLLMDPWKPFVVSMLPLCTAALLGSWSLALLLVRGSRWLSGETVDIAEVEVVTTSSSTSVIESADAGAQADTPSTSQDTEKKTIFEEDHAARYAIASIGLVFVDQKTPSIHSETYRKWILVSYSFYEFRRTLPRAFTEAWTGTGLIFSPDDRSLEEAISDVRNEDSSSNNDAGHEQPTMSPSMVSETAAREHYSPLPRSKRLLWATLLYGGAFFVQLFFFLFFAMTSLYDHAPVSRVAKKLVKCVKPEEHWVAFAIFNLATAAVYYFVAYDGYGTVNPSWTNLLNR